MTFQQPVDTLDQIRQGYDLSQQERWAIDLAIAKLLEREDNPPTYSQAARYSEQLTDIIDKLRLLRAEVDDCATQPNND